MSDNYLMLSPDNTSMARIDKKKAHWYLSRKLAKQINEKTIQLLFVPKGTGKSDHPYYLQEISNICVVCGIENNLTKHHIVPHRYRKHFPDNIKSHSSYDVLLLCRDCHDKYEVEAEAIKKDIYKKYTGKDLKEEFYKSNKYRKITNKIKLLFDNNLSTEVKNKIRESLKDSDIIINNNEKYDSPLEGLEVAKNVKDFVEFYIFWRKHFVSVMSPEYLPKYWNVEENII